MISRILRNILPSHIIYEIERPFREKLQNARQSYSQEGEDMVLARYFQGKESGFYVDIGAHHPVRFSNTYHFYLNGWAGINIEALPGSKRKFDELRPRDINLELAIADSETIATYYMFNEPALNTFNQHEAEYKAGLTDYHLVNSVGIPTRRLSTVLDEYAGLTVIDFMSIDVEGLEMQVLKSNDWRKYRPRILLVELLRHTVPELFKSELYAYLTSREYEMVSKTYNTLFFMDSMSVSGGQ